VYNNSRSITHTNIDGPVRHAEREKREKEDRGGRERETEKGGGQGVECVQCLELISDCIHM